MSHVELEEKVMEVVWHILLTVCLGSTCIQQDVPQFETKVDCDKMLKLYSEIPADGDWDTVEYICKPVGPKSNLVLWWNW